MIRHRQVVVGHRGGCAAAVVRQPQARAAEDGVHETASRVVEADNRCDVIGGAEGLAGPFDRLQLRFGGVAQAEHAARPFAEHVVDADGGRVVVQRVELVERRGDAAVDQILESVGEVHRRPFLACCGWRPIGPK